MQKARRHPTKGLRPLVSTRFQVLFHSLIQGTFHLSLTVLVRYRYSRSIQPYQMVLADSDRIPRVPPYSGYRYRQNMHTLKGLSPSMAQLSSCVKLRINIRYRGPTTPIKPEPDWFRLFPVRSPLLRESFLFSFPPVTQMFQFTGLAPFGDRSSTCRVAPFGNLRISARCSSPKLIAAYHVLHRLQIPRHPPCALN